MPGRGQDPPQHEEILAALSLVCEELGMDLALVSEQGDERAVARFAAGDAETFGELERLPDSCFEAPVGHGPVLAGTRSNGAIPLTAVDGRRYVLCVFSRTASSSPDEADEADVTFLAGVGEAILALVAPEPGVSQLYPAKGPMRSRALRLQLRGGPTAPSSARAALAGIFAELEPDPRFAAELLVSELVTNGVVHGGAGPADALVLSVVLDDEALIIDVADRGQGFEQRAEPARETLDDLGGRGLHLVNGLARRWGVRDGGRRVWFELGLEEAAAA